MVVHFDMHPKANFTFYALGEGKAQKNRIGYIDNAFLHDIIKKFRMGKDDYDEKDVEIMLHCACAYHGDRYAYCLRK